MSAPTLAQVRTLYKATLAASSRFASYNFRTHFLRRADELFKPVITTLESSQSPANLGEFYAEQTKELEVLKRAAEVNRAFEGPKLVVEHPRIITSGGGAGMEASAGGGGQP